MIYAVLLLCVAVAALGTGLVVLWQRQATGGVLARRERKQWVITLKSGEAFRGVLTDHDKGCVVLANAEHYSDPLSPIPVDGEVVVLLSDIKYAQRP